MKRVLLLLVAVISFYNVLFSQVNKSQNNVWLFGFGAGINFSTPDGEPVPFNLYNRIATIEGTASISDENGNLLFYTDGVKVWDKNHNEMPNGNGLLGSISSSNSALIIPNPKLKNIFYIFTAPGAEVLTSLGLTNPNTGIHYSTVDLNLNNGFGDISQKNILLYYPSTEKLAAVKNLTNNTIWVITHEWQTNSFKSFLVDKNGVNAVPVVSGTGTVHSGGEVVATGRLAISPDGTKLIVPIPYTDAFQQGGKVELVDFNPNTGEVSNPQLLETNLPTYSAAFSGNGKVLYLRTNREIWQYDLTKCNIDSIRKSKYIVSKLGYPFYNAIERGPNGKIYVVNDQQNNLDVIDKPNLLGANCDYKSKVISFNGKGSWGFPTFLQSYFDGKFNDLCAVKPETTVTHPERVCFGDSVYLKVKVNFADKFKCSVYRTFPKFEELYVSNATDSIANIVLAPFTDYNNNLRVVVEDSQNASITDTVRFQIGGWPCCSDVVLNGKFIAVAAGGQCFTVEYDTDFDFRVSKTNRCQDQFTALGQMNSQASAAYGNANLDSFSRTSNSHFIFGDPLINIPQRAWYQKNPTRIGSKYKFTAYVRNVEKTIRNNTTNGKSLNFWLGTKDNISSDTIARISNVEYNQGWLELTGIFTARVNETELSVGVLGTSADNLSSYGFGIDDITLIPLPDYNFNLQDTIIVNIGEQVNLDAKINTNVSATWKPTTGLDNPNALNPIATPKQTTMYYLEVSDKYGCTFKDSILVVVNKPTISLIKPSYACLGDSIFLTANVNFANKFKYRVLSLFPKRGLIIEQDAIDSVLKIVLPPSNDFGSNSYKIIVEDFANKNISDSLIFTLNIFPCCGDVVKNGSFVSGSDITFCKTIDYETDFDFRSSQTNRCPTLFTALGQMNSESTASLANPNFDANSIDNNSRFIFGDPLINIPQRAWYQKNPTRIGSKYKFTAYVRNVEKITRNNTTNGKSLNFWLGTKDNVSSDTIARIANVEYNQDWLEFSGIFTAKVNETELSVGVLGTSADNLSSYGFGIDDITLIPLPDYDLAIINKDTVICELDSMLLVSNINTLVNVKWTPTTGLTNPNSLSTIAKPTTPTLYKLEATDKYGCKFIDSIFVDLKSCKASCKPIISISLSDTTIEVGEKFCINGTLLAQCDSLELPDTLKVTFKIPSKLFKVITASESYEIQKENDFVNLVLKFSKNKVILNQDYKFEICLNSLLSDTLKGEFAADEDTSKYILVLNDSSYINLQLCGEKIRLINFFLITNFDASVSDDKIKIFLTTEEQGEFKFTLINMNGSQVVKFDFKTTKSTYNKELIEEIDISQISSGTYTMRMRKPDGKFRTRTIVIVK